MTIESLDPKEIFSKRKVQEVEPAPSVNNKAQLNELAEQVARQFASNSVSPYLITGIVRIADLLGIAAISMVVYLMYVAHGEYANLYPYMIASAVGSVITFSFIQAFDGYAIANLRSFISVGSKTVSAFLLAMLMLLVISFFAKLTTEFSRVWFASWFLSSLVYLMGVRGLVSYYVKNLASEGRLERRAVIVGGGQPAAELIHQLESNQSSDIRVCGIFDDRDERRSPAIVAGYPKLGTIDELINFARMAKINMLIVTLPLSAEKRVLQLLKRLWILPVDIRLSAHSNKLRFRPRSYSYEGAVPFLDLFDKPIADWDALMKRGFDIVLSGLGLILLSPIMIGAAIAVKLESKGPILFRQKRYGFNNEVVDVLKFRSMYHEMADPEAKNVVSKNDPRVTRVGRFIRKTSIDELPQLFNVLTGELSLVGPRPHAVNAQTKNKMWDEVVDGYFARHKVKPGVTGWAQVNGWRGEVDNPEKIKQRVTHDLYYIENWSLMFDLYIVMITPFKLLNTENAY